MTVRIITDSASDLQGLERDDVTIVPLGVIFGEDSFLDGVELSRRGFYERLIESDELPVTSQVNPAQFEDAFARAVKAGEEVIAITLSSKLSGTYASACIAARDYDERVHVIDSLNVSIGEGALVMRACELVDEGLSAADICATLEREKHDINVIALLDTLEYLKRGGRISPAAAAVGGMLTIKPVIAIEHGEVVMLGKARGSRRGNNLLVEQIGKTAGIDFDRPYGLGYSGLDNGLLRKYVEDSRHLWEDHADELPVYSIGGVIGTHTGPGAIGVAFFQLAE